MRDAIRGHQGGAVVLSPVLFAAFRNDVANVPVITYAARMINRPLPRTLGEWTLVAVGATLLIAGYYAFLFVGERTTISAAATVVVSLSPVLTTAFARALLPGEHLTVVGVVGLVFGLADVGLLAAPTRRRSSPAEETVNCCVRCCTVVRAWERTQPIARGRPPHRDHGGVVDGRGASYCTVSRSDSVNRLWPLRRRLRTCGRTQ